MGKKRRYPVLTALKGRIREQNSTYRELAADMGISANSLSDKINGFFPFNLPEVEALAMHLGIPYEEMGRFFFPTLLKNSAKLNSTQAI